MKKPIVLILLGGLLLGGIGGGAYLYVSGQSSEKPEISATPQASPTVAPVLVPWDDPAGFTMQYPKHLSVNKHEEDKENYAHVELTDPQHPGNVTVWVKDLPRKVTDTASWAKQMATPSSAISFDTTLGGKPAQKVLVSQPTKTMTTGIVYDGVLWYVEALLTDEPYWQSVFETVVNSFAFKPLENEAPAGGAAVPDDGGAVDEEEVLE